MRFFRKEYWGGLPCPSPGDLPDPGIEPRSPALQGDYSSSEPPGKDQVLQKSYILEIYLTFCISLQSNLLAHFFCFDWMLKSCFLHFFSLSFSLLIHLHGHHWSSKYRKEVWCVLSEYWYYHSWLKSGLYKMKVLQKSKCAIYQCCQVCYDYNSIQLLSHVRLFASPWTAARQASPSITNSWSPPKPMSIESVIPSNHRILCHPLLLLPSIFPSIRVFSNESALHIRWPKYWGFSFSNSLSNEFRIGFLSTCGMI